MSKIPQEFLSGFKMYPDLLQMISSAELKESPDQVAHAYHQLFPEDVPVIPDKDSTHSFGQLPINVAPKFLPNSSITIAALDYLDKRLDYSYGYDRVSTVTETTHSMLHFKSIAFDPQVNHNYQYRARDVHAFSNMVVQGLTDVVRNIIADYSDVVVYHVGKWGHTIRLKLADRYNDFFRGTENIMCDSFKDITFKANQKYILYSHHHEYNIPESIVTDENCIAAVVYGVDFFKSCLRSDFTKNIVASSTNAFDVRFLGKTFKDKKVDYDALTLKYGTYRYAHGGHLYPYQFDGETYRLRAQNNGMVHTFVDDSYKMVSYVVLIPLKFSSCLNYYTPSYFGNKLLNDFPLRVYDKPRPLLSLDVPLSNACWFKEKHDGINVFLIYVQNEPRIGVYSRSFAARPELRWSFSVRPCPDSFIIQCEEMSSTSYQFSELLYHSSVFLNGFSHRYAFARVLMDSLQFTYVAFSFVSKIQDLELSKVFEGVIIKLEHSYYMNNKHSCSTFYVKQRYTVDLDVSTLRKYNKTFSGETFVGIREFYVDDWTEKCIRLDKRDPNTPDEIFMAFKSLPFEVFYVGMSLKTQNDIPPMNYPKLLIEQRDNFKSRFGVFPDYINNPVSSMNELENHMLLCYVFQQREYVIDDFLIPNQGQASRSTGSLLNPFSLTGLYFEEHMTQEDQEPQEFDPNNVS